MVDNLNVTGFVMLLCVGVFYALKLGNRFMNYQAEKLFIAKR